MRYSLLLLVITTLLALQVSAQHRVGPVYPENRTDTRNWSSSGYDPFHFNWTTGRWDNVPIPYDVTSGPFALNWHTGTWDYAPNYFVPSGIYGGRQPERDRPDGAGPAVATIPARQIPSVDGAMNASATLQPAQSALVNRPSLMRRAFNYSTSDPSFDDWYRSTSK